MIHAAWFIPAFPLAGFLLLVLLGKRAGEPGAGWLATLAVRGFVRGDVHHVCRAASAAR